jgi:CspA family cold shock protein
LEVWSYVGSRHAWSGYVPGARGRVNEHGRNRIMASGKVKWFDNRRGFGFIAQESGQDVFVHHSSILGKGYKILNEGETVKFEVVNSDKGPKAKNVERLPRQG